MKYRKIYWWFEKRIWALNLAMRLSVFLVNKCGWFEPLRRFGKEFIEWGFDDSLKFFSYFMDDRPENSFVKQRLKVVSKIEGFLFWGEGVNNRKSVLDGCEAFSVACEKYGVKEMEGRAFGDSGDYKFDVSCQVMPVAVLSLFPETAESMRGKLSAMEIVRQINVLLFGDERGYAGWEEKKRPRGQVRKVSAVPLNGRNSI